MNCDLIRFSKIQMILTHFAPSYVSFDRIYIILFVAPDFLSTPEVAFGFFPAQKIHHLFLVLFPSTCQCIKAPTLFTASLYQNTGWIRFWG